MFDIWVGGINLTLLVLAFSVIIVFPAQLLLCFCAKSRWLRVAPVLLFTALVLLSLAMMGASTGWDGIGHLLLAIYAGFGMLVCGTAWAIWVVIKVVKKHIKAKRI